MLGLVHLRKTVQAFSCAKYDEKYSLNLKHITHMHLVPWLRYTSTLPAHDGVGLCWAI